MADAIRVVFNRMPQLSREVERRAAVVVETHARALEADAKAQMAEPKTGEMYGAHQASAPGEAPAIDTGELVNSIGSQEAGRLTWQVYASAEYALPLEYGTARGMAARPFFRPAAERIRKPFIAAMREVVQP